MMSIMIDVNCDRPVVDKSIINLPKTINSCYYVFSKQIDTYWIYIFTLTRLSIIYYKLIIMGEKRQYWNNFFADKIVSWFKVIDCNFVTLSL